MRRLDGMRGINTHCHHLPDAQFSGVDLKFLYDHSYCDWMDSYPADASAVPDFLLRNCGNSYFYWLQTAIAALYGLPVSGENLDKLNLAIADAYRDETPSFAHFGATMPLRENPSRQLRASGMGRERWETVYTGAALQHVCGVQLQNAKRP